MLVEYDRRVSFKSTIICTVHSFQGFSPHLDLDLPTQNCSPAPVCTLMHMALAGLLAKCQCICSLYGACACYA